MFLTKFKPLCFVDKTATAWISILPLKDACRNRDFHPERIILIFLVFICSTVSAESLREYHQRKCTEGVEESCHRAEDLLEGERHAERIVELGDKFAETVDRNEFEEDNKPILKKSYLPILNDYFKNEAENGIKPLVSNDVLEMCAEHFHDHWRNRKLWWPTDEDVRPDWSTIYYYTVEHYYGFCLRSVL